MKWWVLVTLPYIRKIVTSPNYSSDGFVAFVFSSDAEAPSGDPCNNGFCYSSNR